MRSPTYTRASIIAPSVTCIAMRAATTSGAQSAVPVSAWGVWWPWHYGPGLPEAAEACTSGLASQNCQCYWLKRSSSTGRSSRIIYDDQRSRNSIAHADPRPYDFGGAMR